MAPEAAGDILKLMPIPHAGLYLVVLAGLCCLWLGIWVVRLLWRELSDFMHNQRSGD